MIKILKKKCSNNILLLRNEKKFSAFYAVFSFVFLISSIISYVIYYSNISKFFKNPNYILLFNLILLLLMYLFNKFITSLNSNNIFVHKLIVIQMIIWLRYSHSQHFYQINHIMEYVNSILNIHIVYPMIHISVLLDIFHIIFLFYQMFRFKLTPKNKHIKLSPYQYVIQNDIETTNNISIFYFAIGCMTLISQKSIILLNLFVEPICLILYVFFNNVQSNIITYSPLIRYRILAESIETIFFTIYRIITGIAKKSWIHTAKLALPDRYQIQDVYDATSNMLLVRPNKKLRTKFNISILDQFVYRQTELYIILFFLFNSFVKFSGFCIDISVSLFYNQTTYIESLIYLMMNRNILSMIQIGNLRPLHNKIENILIVELLRMLISNRGIFLSLINALIIPISHKITSMKIHLNSKLNFSLLSTISKSKINHSKSKIDHNIEQNFIEYYVMYDRLERMKAVLSILEYAEAILNVILLIATFCISWKGIQHVESCFSLSQMKKYFFQLDLSMMLIIPNTMYWLGVIIATLMKELVITMINLTVGCGSIVFRVLSVDGINNDNNNEYQLDLDAKTINKLNIGMILENFDVRFIVNKSKVTFYNQSLFSWYQSKNISILINAISTIECFKILLRNDYSSHSIYSRILIMILYFILFFVIFKLTVIFRFIEKFNISYHYSKNKIKLLNAKVISKNYLAIQKIFSQYGAKISSPLKMWSLAANIVLHYPREVFLLIFFVGMKDYNTT